MMDGFHVSLIVYAKEYRFRHVAFNFACKAKYQN
jgi:hypothetical protein